MNARHLVAATMTLVLLSANLAKAEERRWSMPNLWPFGKKESTAGTRSASTRRPSPGQAGINSIPFPGMTGIRRPAPATRRASEPSTMQRFTAGTKRFFSRVGDTLTPWDNDPKPTQRRPPWLGSRSANNREKKSFFSSMFQREPKYDRPQTVPEFLAQPRVE